jgi:heat shock protein HslJ
MKKFICILGLGTLLLIMAACTSGTSQAGGSSDLAGTSWTATGYDDGSQTVTDVLAGSTLTANFGEDGTMSGNSGCNDYSGPYKITSNQIGIGPVSTTRKACSDPAGVMEQEAQYLAALENAEVFVVNGDVLELREVDGTVMAQFTKK